MRRQVQREGRRGPPLQEPLAVDGGGPVAQPDAAAEDDEGEDQDPHSRVVVVTMSTTASFSGQLDLRVGREGIWIRSAMGRAER